MSAQLFTPQGSAANGNSKKGIAMKTIGSTVINAPLDEVWALLRDFGGLTRWFSGVASCEIKDGKSSDQIGSVRIVAQSPGGPGIGERLTEMSDDDHAFAYRIEVPVDLGAVKVAWGSRGRVRLAAVTDRSQTFIEWSHDSDVIEGDPGVLIGFYQQVYAAFFEALRKFFN